MKHISPTSTDRQKKLRWEARHELLSVSVASNVPGHETPQCFVSEGSPAQLVSDMGDYLHTISQAAYTTLLEKFHGVFEELNELMDAMTDGMEQSTNFKHIKKVKEQLDEYLKELPVLGFNSGKYDINVIKRTNTYMALKTEMLKFFDISNYLAPGYNYYKFLKAYECGSTKCFFSYEWIDDIQKLDDRELPPHQAFHSKLKGSNISKDEYTYCQNVWKEQSTTSVRYFLVWYNNLDVVPFLEALEKMFTFYINRNMGMFKSASSVPGLLLQYIFLTLPKDAFFSLIDEANKDLFYKIKENIVGGPSIVIIKRGRQSFVEVLNCVKTLWGLTPTRYISGHSCRICPLGLSSGGMANRGLNQREVISSVSWQPGGWTGRLSHRVFIFNIGLTARRCVWVAECSRWTAAAKTPTLFFSSTVVIGTGIPVS